MFRIVRTKTIHRAQSDEAYKSAIKMLIDGWPLSPMAIDEFKNMEVGALFALADFKAVRDLHTRLRLCEQSQSSLLDRLNYHKKISKGRLAKIKKLQAYIEQLKEATP